MYDLLHFVYHVAEYIASASPMPTPLPSPSPSPSSPSVPNTGLDSSVKVAIVTAIGVVLAAAVTAFASTFQRDRAARSTVPANDTFTRQYINGLLADQRELRKLREAYNHLREGIIELGQDPDQIIAHQVQQNGGTP